MLQSILHDDVQYIQNKYVSKNDIGTKVKVYDVELFGVQMAISLGEIVDTFIDKQIYYCPVYAIISKINVEKIGYFEFYKQELSFIMDSDGDIDISLLEGPLTFNYVDGDYLLSIIGRGNFLKMYNLEEEKFNKLTLEKSKTKTSKTKKMDKAASKTMDVGESKDASKTNEVGVAELASLSSVAKDNADKSLTFDSVGEINNISKIKQNGEKKLNESFLNESKKTYLQDIKSFKDSDVWLQKHYRNNNFEILDVEANGDCFFATIREAFKGLGVIVTVETLRKILSNHVTENHFKTNKTLYKDYVKAMKQFQKDAIQLNTNLKDLMKKRSDLMAKAKKSKDDRTKIKKIGEDKKILEEKIQTLGVERKRLLKNKKITKQLYDEKKFMKNVKSFKDYKQVINTTAYWADETAISILEFLFNIKIIILSEERFDNGEVDVLSCGTTILTPIEKRGEFNPKYYIIVNHTGNHYKLIKYKEQSLFTFYDLPDIIRENIKTTCSTSIFNYIPLFNAFFKKSK